MPAYTVLIDGNRIYTFKAADADDADERLRDVVYEQLRSHTDLSGHPVWATNQVARLERATQAEQRRLTTAIAEGQFGVFLLPVQPARNRPR